MLEGNGQSEARSATLYLTGKLSEANMPLGSLKPPVLFSGSIILSMGEVWGKVCSPCNELVCQMLLGKSLCFYIACNIQVWTLWLGACSALEFAHGWLKPEADPLA